ncbi:MAG: tryptophan 2,3-dioxygenase [Thermoleophilaceae bacterium]
MTRSRHQQALTYASYLCLDELLAAQRPRSDEHDEVLFIVIHQVYELWFKQLLHELRALQRRFEHGDGPHELHTLRRVRAILKTIVAQIDVLETMTPREFAGFRSRLESASGFQSAQFRELEAVLGRRDPDVLLRYPRGSAGYARIAAALEKPSVVDSFLRYLAARGYPVPATALERDIATPLEPSEAVQDVLLAVYRDEAEPAQVSESLVDVDEGLQEWRYRHVKMVERTIGDKPGTGGSPGAAYLRRTLFQPVFPDLWAIRNRI